ncbi:MAG: transporter [Helicobacteraceae bacterium 4484_230]|nr:MAG: transporter [Helicobacteraceae bacterium 4484_230]
MDSVIFSVFGIYIFIAVGFAAKLSFKEKIDDRTIILLSVYFLQIFLTFWGLLKRPIDSTLLYAPLMYVVIVLLTLLITFPFVKKLFKDPKERSIATVAALIGNTGNLGGVYFYSRGSFSARTSLINILKLPILWAAMIAITLNLGGYEPSDTVDKTLQMGAYASMVVQLLLFGIYLYDVRIKTLNRMLIAWVGGIKFLLLPLLAFALLSLVDMDPMVKGILFLELIMPLAVANVNLGSLYECRPRDITALVFITSILFLGIVFVAMRIVRYF